MIELKRVYFSEQSTQGVLFVDSIPVAVTLELPPRNNEKNISCIPAGDYPVVKYLSEKYGSTYLVNDVPNRSGIIIHAGNWPSDTHGCILLGSSFNNSSTIDMIGGSKIAMTKFLGLMQNRKTDRIVIS